MRQWIHKLTYYFVIALSLPSAIVILTWNSLPGDFDYPIKSAMESALLIIASPSYAASGNLHIAYTERRFDEAEQLLDKKQSVVGLVLLSHEVSQTRSTILGAHNKKKQEQLAKRYIQTLEDLSSQLDVKKNSITTSMSQQQTSPQETILRSTPRSTPTITAVPTTQTVQSSNEPDEIEASPTPTTLTIVPPILPTNTAPPAQSTQDIVDTITQTQDTIDQTIDDLQNFTEGYSNFPGQGQNHDFIPPGQERQNSGNDNDDKNDDNQNRGRGQNDNNNNRNNSDSAGDDD